MSDDVRRFDKPRAVQVLHDGRWVPGWQDGWIRWPDGEWRAAVRFRVEYDWGTGNHVMSVAADRVRLR